MHRLDVRVPPFTEPAVPEVLYDDHVSRDSLLRLVSGQALAIVVPDYYPADLCHQVTRWLLEDDWFREYENVPGVHKWGLNTYEGLSSADREERYFRDAIPAIRALRDRWFPNLSPIDRLRLELQEAWPAGANLEHLDGRTLFVGQARVFKRGDGAVPHQDFLPWELTDLRRSERSDGVDAIVGQLTANVYLRTPQSGGELELWSTGYDHADYDRLRHATERYGLDRTGLPAPAVTLKPTDGMLILFHATRPHAIHAAEDVDRVALSCFIGIRNPGHPLTYWS